MMRDVGELPKPARLERQRSLSLDISWPLRASRKVQYSYETRRIHELNNWMMGPARYWYILFSDREFSRTTLLSTSIIIN